eukprot:2175232-Rhodomonas_salina.1
MGPSSRGFLPGPKLAWSAGTWMLTVAASRISRSRASRNRRATEDLYAAPGTGKSFVGLLGSGRVKRWRAEASERRQRAMRDFPSRESVGRPVSL